MDDEFTVSLNVRVTMLVLRLNWVNSTRLGGLVSGMKTVGKRPQPSKTGARGLRARSKMAPPVKTKSQLVPFLLYVHRGSTLI